MPSRSSRTRTLTQAERAELSNSRMIESAMTLIVERGASGMQLTDVGLRAGYSRGLATMRFGTKAGLLRQIVRQGQVNWVRRLAAAVGDKTGLAAVHAAIDAQDDTLQGHALEMRAIYAILFQSYDPREQHHAEVARMLAAQRRDLTNWLRAAHAAGEIPRQADPVRVAGQILSAMLGIVYQWIMDPTAPSKELHMGIRQWLDEWLGVVHVGARPASRRASRGAASARNR
jgi:AcrR family transcriptional regulator